MDDLDLCILLEMAYWVLTDSDRASQCSIRLPRICCDQASLKNHIDLLITGPI